jgi:hypothetical protein
MVSIEGRGDHSASFFGRKFQPSRTLWMGMAQAHSHKPSSQLQWYIIRTKTKAPSKDAKGFGQQLSG